MTDLRGHVALVTGGNGGIGLGMAAGLAHAGADIAIWGRNTAKNAAACDQLSALGRRVHAEQCDISDEEQVIGCFARTVDALGKVDSVFANAGETRRTPSILEVSMEDWRHVVRVNLDGTFMTLREGARHMVARGEGGSLVAVSSTSALQGNPINPHYAAAKTGVLGLVKAMAVAFARNKIRVNAFMPGWTDTDLLMAPKQNPKFVDATVGRTPVRRWADPAEYGEIAVFLANPALTFHTGDTILADGGYSLA